MRWFGSAFFLIVAVGFALFAVVLFSATSDSDTARGVVVGVGVLFVLLALGAAGGGIWAFRRLGSTHREPDA
jgi:hypothetical protein